MAQHFSERRGDENENDGRLPWGIALPVVLLLCLGAWWLIWQAIITLL